MSRSIYDVIREMNEWYFKAHVARNEPVKRRIAYNNATRCRTELKKLLKSRFRGLYSFEKMIQCVMDELRFLREREGCVHLNTVRSVYSVLHEVMVEHLEHSLSVIFRIELDRASKNFAECLKKYESRQEPDEEMQRESL